ncbi:MAG: sorbosone dehydrogenase family protein [Bradymonadaceae bacterium]
MADDTIGDVRDAAPDGEDGPAVGLDRRPTNDSCVAPPRPTRNTDVRLTRAYPNLSFNQPLRMVQPPADGADAWFVVEQPGEIYRFPDAQSVQNAELFADLTGRVDDSGNEMGLLGLAFHPDWPRKKLLYMNYTTSQTGTRKSRISEFRVKSDRSGLVPGSEKILLSLQQPFSNHNGGHVTFGPDGYLYSGFGDGGAGGDPLGSGQDTSTLLGSLIRIDVDGGDPYAIPPDNPFADGNGGRPEIYAWGLRNPWRFSFDTATGRLWVADVGQNDWEEVNIVEKGGNYGWNVMEGKHCYSDPNCDKCPYDKPVVEYSIDGRHCSVTGGYVYRGDDLPSLRGAYIYGDFCSGQIWGLVPTGKSGDLENRALIDTSHRITSFAQSRTGEIYLTDRSGTLWRLAPPENGGGGDDSFPTKLSETGCVDPDHPTQPADGLIPYTVNAPFWSDGADKSRYLAIPAGETIQTGGEDGWSLPKGSVVVKNFKFGSTFIETRLFMRHPDGSWAGYSYDWNDQQTEATLVEGGKVAQVQGQKWVFPSRSDCLTCHTEAAGRTLGLKTAQLNGHVRYPSTNRRAHQVATLDHIGMFETSPLDGGGVGALPRMPDPFGDAPLERRARSYLHTNCSQCHRPGTGLRSGMDTRFGTSFADTGMCGEKPTTGDLGIDGARLLKPGAPDQSLIHVRADRRDADGMPPLASRKVDSRGVQLLANWIRSVSSCP